MKHGSRSVLGQQRHTGNTDLFSQDSRESASRMSRISQLSHLPHAGAHQLVNATVHLVDRMSHVLTPKGKKAPAQNHGVAFAKPLVTANGTTCPPPPSPEAKIGSRSEGYDGLRLTSPQPEQAARFRQHSEARAVARAAVEQHGRELSANALCAADLCPEVTSAVGIALAADLLDAWDRSQRCTCDWHTKVQGQCPHVEPQDFPPIRELTSAVINSLGVVIPDAEIQRLAAAGVRGYSVPDADGGRKPRKQRGSVLALLGIGAGGSSKARNSRTL